MKETILNQDLFENKIKKTILDSFVKGRDEMIKRANYILSVKNNFTLDNDLILAIDDFLEDPNGDIKNLYQELVKNSKNEKITEALAYMKERYLNNVETLGKINRMDPEVQIMDEKDLVDISEAFQVTLRTIAKMLKELKKELIAAN